MIDVLIAGAGPAGAIASLILARAGARVRLLDRATFPRDKLCGDTLNPGALALLRRLGIAARIEERGLRIDGMIVTGEGGVRVEARYPDGACGRALVRRELDQWLLDEATRAGAEFEEGVVVRGAVVDAQARDGATVRGLRLAGRRGAIEMRAPLTIAADGRHSALAFGLGLARHPERPRRWAIGTYFDGVSGLTSCGEMHVRRDHYLGIASLPGGIANACLVINPGGRAGANVSAAERRSPFRDPAAVLRAAIDADPMLRERFAGARMIAPPAVMGPLAVDVSSPGLPGLLLAGDAAGFIDPMTGDGLRFAIRGAELAAHAALADPRVALRSLARTRAEFAGKRRFNRTLRWLVGSPAAVDLAALVARACPGALRQIVAIAGDVSSR